VSQSEAQATQTNGTRLFTDSAGRTVEVLDTITRVIPSGAMAQMFLWPLAADKLVSTAEAFTDEQLELFGSRYAELPITGNLYKTGSQLNIEEVASLDAQIIIDYGEAKDSIAEDLDALQELLGIPCVFIEGSLNDSANSYRMLGELLGMEPEAEPIALYIEQVMGEVYTALDSVTKATAVVISNTDSLGCVASGTYFDEIWALMTDNVAVVDDGQMYTSTTIDFEQLMLWDPEFIFFYGAANAEDCLSQPQWEQLQAVQLNQCYQVPVGAYSFVSPPSVNRYLGLVWLGSVLYPDAFSWDVVSMTQQYYALFYHAELSAAQAAQLLGSQTMG
jgi:iron complex transport system substrate-binding protein